MYRCILFVITLLFGCQQEMPPAATALTDAEIDQVKMEVQEAMNQMELLSETVDTDGVVNLISDHPDFRFISNGHVIESKQRYIDEVVPGWSNNVKSEDIEEEESQITVLSKDAAIYFVVSNSTITSPDGTVNPPFKYVVTFIWHKNGSDWQVLHFNQAVVPINET